MNFPKISYLSKKDFQTLLRHTGLNTAPGCESAASTNVDRGQRIILFLKNNAVENSNFSEKLEIRNHLKGVFLSKSNGQNTRL